MTANEKLKTIVRSLDEHLARNIVVIDVSAISSVTDYFVFATGNSTTQVKALCDYVERDLQKADITAARVEGYASARWILLDYTDVVLHIFGQEAREFYDLERLWKDGNIVDIQQFLGTEEI